MNIETMAFELQLSVTSSVGNTQTVRTTWNEDADTEDVGPCLGEAFADGLRGTSQSRPMLILAQAVSHLADPEECGDEKDLAFVLAARAIIDRFEEIDERNRAALEES